MKNINAAIKYLQGDLDVFNSQLNNFIKELKNSNDFKFKSNRLLSSCVNKNLINIVENSLTAGAKRIRPLFCYWILRCFSKNEVSYSINLEKTTQIALAIEILHNASLIIDDIEDGSLERRQKSALHIQYGIPNALNAGSWMYFLALTRLPPELQELASLALSDCHIGQAIDLSSSQEDFLYDLLSSSDKERWDYYEKCVELKTTKLILLSAQCLEKVLDINKFDCEFIHEIIKRYGLIFQLFDDIKNLFPEFSGNKTYEDLKNGFRSAVSIEYLNLLSQSEKNKIFELINKKYFYDYLINDNKLNIALHNCFYKAENMLNETLAYIENYLGKENINCLTILDIFQNPFVEIKKIISHKINEKKFASTGKIAEGSFKYEYN